MAEIRPFKALFYNQEKIKDYSRVVCPPYDIISPQEQEYYHNLHPYNLIHILLGKDVPGEDKYLRAGNFFRDWQKDEVLIRDKQPAIYFYSQQYSVKGETKTRLGFISLLDLSGQGSSVYRHEHTRLAPKEDRLKLLREVGANLSPIFAVFLDHKRVIQRVYKKAVQGKAPFIELTDEEKTLHKLWRLDSPELLSEVRECMLAENIFIADGHHRYEVSCAFREEMRQRLGKAVTGEEGFNYTLVYFTNTDFRGLSILPVHRLLKLEQGFDTEAFRLKLKENFDTEEVKDKTRFLFLLQKCGRSEHVLGVYINKRYWLLRLKNVRILDRLISGSKAYRSLDVSILNQLILKNIFGLDLESRENIKFSPSADELISELDKGGPGVLFLLNPVKIQEVISVALNGERMPPKSTYFYPKVLSGLAINILDD